jgi:alpha-D-ribose 1-methylphosphonate 5-triphosphate synthase subunit PhnL
LTGGALGLGLTLFHHLVERRLSPVMAGNPSGLVYVEQRLRVVPRVGLLVLLVVMGAMMYAARGF